MLHVLVCDVRYQGSFEDVQSSGIAWANYLRRREINWVPSYPDIENGPGVLRPSQVLLGEELIWFVPKPCQEACYQFSPVDSQQHSAYSKVLFYLADMKKTSLIWISVFFPENFLLLLYRHAHLGAVIVL